MATANHVLLRRITLTASAASVTLDLTGVSGYTDLKIVASVRTDYSGLYDEALFRYNGDSTSPRYTYRTLLGSGSSAASGNNTGAGFGYFGRPNGATSTSNTFASMELYIPNYAGSNQKSSSIDYAMENNATAAEIGLFANLYNQTTAISSITFSSYYSANFVTGCSFAVYGIANAATTPAAAPKADGGDIIKTDGTYWYHAFLSSGSFKPQLNLTADLLVVAGGGGGGGDTGSGGGAGGVLALASQALASTSTYAITVGAGGAGAPTAASLGSKGGDSSFGSVLSCEGGGYGSYYANKNGGNGGSGGGASQSTGVAGTATSGQGNNGGTNSYDTSGAGGGGKGSTGFSATPAGGNGLAGGNGGAGVNTVTNWGSLSSVLTTLGMGVSGYIAGGGGGGGHSAGPSTVLNPGGTGGSGGGGNGGNYNNAGGGRNVPTAAVAFTGSGGGGDGWFGQAGKSGGSGFIIVRYPVA